MSPRREKPTKRKTSKPTSALERQRNNQQQQLLDDEPAAIAAHSRAEQELHGRPAQPLEAHAVNQMDDDRGADEGAGDAEETRVGEEFKALNAHPIFAADLNIAIRWCKNFDNTASRYSRVCTSW